MTLEAILVIGLGIGLGAIFKGVTGMGLPLLAMPILASYFPLPHAIAIMLVPVTLSNAWQAFSARKQSETIDFLPRMIVAGLVGIILGTVLLKTAPGPILKLVFAGMLLAYVALRAIKPSFTLDRDTARRISAPALFTGGLLQGAVGVAAPAVVTFFNAAQFPRPTHIHVVATVYLSLAVFQLISLTGAGIMRLSYVVEGLIAMIPVIIFMPVGAWLGQRISHKAFDRFVLSILFILALRFMWDAAHQL